MKTLTTENQSDATRHAEVCEWATQTFYAVIRGQEIRYEVRLPLYLTERDLTEFVSGLKTLIPEPNVDLGDNMESGLPTEFHGRISP